MPNEKEIAAYKRILADVESNLKILRRQYDAINPRDADNCISPLFTKRDQLAEMIYEQKLKRFDLLEIIERLETEDDA